MRNNSKTRSFNPHDICGGIQRRWVRHSPEWRKRKTAAGKRKASPTPTRIGKTAKESIAFLSAENKHDSEKMVTGGEHYTHSAKKSIKKDEKRERLGR